MTKGINKVMRIYYRKLIQLQENAKGSNIIGFNSGKKIMREEKSCRESSGSLSFSQLLQDSRVQKS